MWDISQGSVENSRFIYCLGAVQVCSVSTLHQVISCRSPCPLNLSSPSAGWPLLPCLYCFLVREDETDLELSAEALLLRPEPHRSISW